MEWCTLYVPSLRRMVNTEFTPGARAKVRDFFMVIPKTTLSKTSKHVHAAPKPGRAHQLKQFIKIDIPNNEAVELTNCSTK